MTAPRLAFSASAILVLAVLSGLAAIAYFRWFRLTRPAVGVFNGPDVIVMMGFVVVIPFGYLALPGWGLRVVLAAVLFGGLMVGYEPVVRRAGVRCAAVLVLLAVDAVAGGGWYWLANSLLVLLMVVAAANLSVQGGLRLRHVGIFVLCLGCYDVFFATVVPLTQRLAEAVDGQPFAPMAGLRVGELGAAVGMGDLLAYALYAAAAFKAYGRRGGAVALVLIATFGALLPALAPAAIEAVTGQLPTLMPAQAFFGPAGYLGYLILRRHGPERRMAELVHNPLRQRIADPSRSGSLNP